MACRAWRCNGKEVGPGWGGRSPGLSCFYYVGRGVSGNVFGGQNKSGVMGVLSSDRLSRGRKVRLAKDLG